MKCKCGCGKVVNVGKLFIWGHNSRINNPWSGRVWQHSKGKSGLKLGKNPQWKGDAASYIAKHARIERLYGKADRCDFDTTHKTTKYVWANKGHTYKLDREDWVRLCPKCHKKMDGETGSKRSLEFRASVSIGLKRAYAEGRRHFRGKKVVSTTAL